MASEIRVNKINSRTGVGTITLSPTGVDFTGIATVATLKATTGIVTTLSATGDVTIGDKIIHDGDTNTAIRFPDADTFTVETAGSERLRIRSTGWQESHAGYAGVGINTFASWARTGGAIRAEVGYNAVTTDYMYFGTGTSHPLALRVNNDNAVYIKTDGNVGIGTENPSGLLHISKSGGNAKLIIQRSNTASNTNDYGSILWRSSAANNNALIGAARHSAENDAYMFFSTANGGTLSERMRILSTGGLTFNGDTATANALDDYEEGTWTVTLAPGSGFTPTSNTSTGYYTKIGRQVTVIGRAVMTIPSSLGSYTNNNTGHGLAVSGLPFTSINASSQGRSAPVIGVTDNVGVSAGTLAGHGTANSTQFSIYVNKDNGGTRVSPNLTASETVAIHFCFTYIV